MAVSCGLYRAADHISSQQAKAYYKYVFTYFNPEMDVRISNVNLGGWMNVWIRKPDRNSSAYTRMFSQQKRGLLHMADTIMARHGIIAEDILG